VTETTKAHQQSTQESARLRLWVVKLKFQEVLNRLCAPTKDWHVQISISRTVTRQSLSLRQAKGSSPRSTNQISSLPPFQIPTFPYRVSGPCGPLLEDLQRQRALWTLSQGICHSYLFVLVLCEHQRSGDLHYVDVSQVPGLTCNANGI